MTPCPVRVCKRMRYNAPTWPGVSAVCQTARGESIQGVWWARRVGTCLRVLACGGCEDGVMGLVGKCAAASPGGAMKPGNDLDRAGLGLSAGCVSYCVSQ
jgi:hypothetical protein